MDDQQMPCWYYEREELLMSPSFVIDRIDHDTEAKYRREGARFLFSASNELNLRYDTCATAIVFFHRFYMCHSFKAFPRYVTAACCLMLAGKVEETPKKVRDIVKVARTLLPEAVFVEQFGTADPREEVMAYERVLLKTIKFDLQVSHPYFFLLQFVKRIKGNKEKLKELVQMAWSFINDSLSTTLCLQWEPEVVACAVLYLATRMSKYTIEDWEGRQPGLRWWESFVVGMSTEVMEDICHKILDLYPADGGAPITANTPASSSSTAAVKDRHGNHHQHHHHNNSGGGSSSNSAVPAPPPATASSARFWSQNQAGHAVSNSTGSSSTGSAGGGAKSGHHTGPNNNSLRPGGGGPPSKWPRRDGDPAPAGYRSGLSSAVVPSSLSPPPPPPPLPQFNSGLVRR